VTIGSIHHIALVVHSIDDALPRYRQLLGWEAESDPFDFASQGVRLCFLAPASGVGARLELVQPLDPEGGVGRFLEARGEGVHHVCLVSDDLPAELDRLAAGEAELIDRAPRAGAHGSVAFIHPRTLSGVLWELLEPSTHEDDR
jgi:methylmalonyl-CoA/ethylmalonyl-CoA epimerase